MARRYDTGWRDPMLAVRHASWGYEAPAPGMILPMVEYDRGRPVALINYQPRYRELPKGDQVAAAFSAFGKVSRSDGRQLPFFTAQYDVRNWAFRLFAHNDAAREFIDRDRWVPMTEHGFVANLYQLRERHMPDLAPYGVTFGQGTWLKDEPHGASTQPWHGADVSERRRNYEPVGLTRFSWRNPCTDIDFAVIDRDGEVAMVVDYKSTGAKVNLASTNVEALSGLYASRAYNKEDAIPAFVTTYQARQGQPWQFSVHPANATARRFLSFVLGMKSSDLDALTGAVAGTDWINLGEDMWCEVLSVAREL